MYHTESKDRASLLTEVRNLHRASDKINQEAENLAKALKGDKRLQGNWGELVLERVLDESGLRRDHEYTLQATRRTEDGDAKRPDVIIHLPDDKDIIVDSKVSLSRVRTRRRAEDDTVRENFLRQHVNDLRAQVKRLSEQEYDRLHGVRSLDFVLLFVPIESAFMLAMEYDQGLFTEAFNKRIVIVSPTTLLMTLRIIHNVWRYEKQTKNAQEIARRAGALYDKLRLVMEDMVKLGSRCAAPKRAIRPRCRSLRAAKAISCVRSSSSGNWAPACVDRFRETCSILPTMRRNSTRRCRRQLTRRTTCRKTRRLSVTPECRPRVSCRGSSRRSRSFRSRSVISAATSITAGLPCMRAWRFRPPSGSR